MAARKTPTTEGPFPKLLSPRTASMVLAAFPWHSDIIMHPFSISQALKEDPATVQNTFLETYASSVGAYEKQIRHRGSLEAAGLWNALEIRPGSDKTAVINITDIANRFYLVSALRLIDLIAASQGYKSKLPVPRHVRSAQLTTSCKNFCGRMANWVEVVRNFKNCIVSVSTIQPSLGATYNDVRVRHLKSLLRSNKMHGVANIFQNFEFAAIYLSYVDRNVAWGTALPDLPNNAQDLASFIMQNIGSNILNTDFTAAELEDLQHMLSGLTAANLRLPINIAVIVTPLVLLLPLKVSSWNWPKSDMLQFSKQLGNIQPDILTKMEKAVIVTLTDIATGKEDALHAVQRLAQSVNLEEFEHCDNEVLEWFSTGPPVPSNPALLLQMNLEQRVDPAWPLAAEMEAEFGDAYKIQGQSLCGVAQLPSSSTAPPEEVQKPGPAPEPTPSRLEEPAARSQPEQNDEQSSSPVGNGKEKSEARKGKQNALRQTNLRKRKSERVAEAGKANEPGSQTESNKRGRPFKSVPVQLPSTTTFRPGNYDPRDIYKSVSAQLPTTTAFRPSNYDPRDIDELDTPMKTSNLCITSNAQKYTAPSSFLIYGPSGERRQIKPIAHHQNNLTQLNSFVNEMHSTFVDGQALHLAQPELSVYKIMTQVQFNTLSVREVQDMLRTHHLVLTDMPGRLNFDEKGLKAMGNVSKTILIQDLSIPVTDSNDVQLKEGKLKNLLAAANNPNAQILNALHFTVPRVPWYFDQISTESTAWHATLGMNFAKEDSQFPDAYYRFGLAATTGATTWWHIDGPFGTIFNVVAGDKVLYTARPINPDSIPLTPKAFDSFAHLALFNSEEFVTEDGLNPLWDVEGIYLPAGTTFIMRPNTPYCTYASENVIAYGSHFWCTTTMKDSAYGIIHSFVSSDLIAKTRHPGSRTMISRIVMFYHRAFVENALEDDDSDREHLPVLTNIEDTINFMSIVVQGLFLNVVDHRTYESPSGSDAELLHENFDFNGLSGRQRRAYVYVRRLAYRLLRWFSASYSFMTPSGQHLIGWNDIILPYISRQARAILQYKFESKDEGIPGATYDAVRMQMIACLQLLPDIGPHLDVQAPSVDDFACNMDRDIVITKKSSRETLVEIDKNWGMTLRDKLFFEYTDSGEQDVDDTDELWEYEEPNDMPPPKKKQKL